MSPKNFVSAQIIRKLSLRTPFKVRLGEWNAGSDNETFPPVEITIANVFVHPMFNSKNLQYDIAMIRLSSNAPLGVTPLITNICLPSAPMSNLRCWVSGTLFTNELSEQGV